MKPTKVSISCNANPFYLEFWEPVSRIWKHKFGLEPYLFFVGRKENVPKKEHGTVVHVPIVKGIPEHTQAQWARLHFLQSDLDAVWITSDIDMFPLSRFYFMEMAQSVSDDCFVSLNSDMRDYFPVCYNMATGRAFRDVLDLKPDFADDVRVVYETTSSDSHVVNGQTFDNWNADERYSSSKICKYRLNKPSKIIQFLRPGGFHGGRRIDRNRWRYNDKMVKSDWYLDCHSLRPYGKHREQIEALLKMAMNT
jgi:hypothetical protein